MICQQVIYPIHPPIHKEAVLQLCAFYRRKLKKRILAYTFAKWRKKMHSIAKRAKNAKLCFAESTQMMLIASMYVDNYFMFAYSVVWQGASNGIAYKVIRE